MSNDTTTVSVFAEKQSGLLVKIIRAFTSQGYELEGHRLTENEAQGEYIITIFIEGLVLLSQESLDCIKNLHPAIKDVQTEQPQNKNSLINIFGKREDISEEEFFNLLIKRHPDITQLLSEYKSYLPVERRMEVMYSLGRNLGTREFKIHYARGNPLDLELTIKRMLILALSEFAEIQNEGHQVAIENCPFCRGGVKGVDADCEFLRGYIWGFLCENSNFNITSVQQIHSSLERGEYCCFEVH